MANGIPDSWKKSFGNSVFTLNVKCPMTIKNQYQWSLLYCRSEETLKAVGPFYLVSMPGEVKDPTQGVNPCVTCRGLHILT